MRKLVLTLVLFACFSSTVAAENIVMVQGMYLNLGRSYAVKVGGAASNTLLQTIATSAWGAAASGWFEVGDDVGVLAGMGLTFPTRAQSTTRSDGKKVGDDLDEELKDGGLFLAAELGAGWKLGARGSAFAAILGGGARVDVATLYQPKDSTDDNVSSNVLGVYLQALPML